MLAACLEWNGVCPVHVVAHTSSGQRSSLAALHLRELRRTETQKMTDVGNVASLRGFVALYVFMLLFMRRLGRAPPLQLCTSVVD